MQKIPTLFKKKYNDNGKYLGVIPEWNVELDPNKLYAVTVKWDGAACAIIDSELYKRYDVKPGKKIPDGAIMCQPYDKDAKHNPCWVKCNRNNPSDKWHWIAFDKMIWYSFVTGVFKSTQFYKLTDWTYELIGAHIQDNPYHCDSEYFIKHGSTIIDILKPPYDLEKIYSSFKSLLSQKHIEGYVLWEIKDIDDIEIVRKEFIWGDGTKYLNKPVAKLRRKDFGYKWNE